MNQITHHKILAVLALIATFSLNACAGLFGIGGMSWKEEVLLHDGRKLVVERSVTRGGHGIAQQSIATEESLSFTLPGTNERVTWSDQFSPDLGSSNFNLMMLEISQDTAYLVASPMGCLSYNKWGRPNPPYVVFQYRDKAWSRIELQNLPREFTTPNLIISSPDAEAKQLGSGTISAEIIKKLNTGFSQPEFRSILREPFATAAGGCSEMISTNDGWEGLGFFRLKASYEACSQYCVQKGVDQQICPCKKLFEGKK